MGAIDLDPLVVDRHDLVAFPVQQAMQRLVRSGTLVIESQTRLAASLPPGGPTMMQLKHPTGSTP
ncbi:MAG: hypothetical protein M3O70_06650 [Actinomycetota bacterium]|nr:hypothetical protein [Actinomycetota bacterium]